MAIQSVAGYVELDPDNNPILHPATLDRNILESIYGRSGATRLGEWQLFPGASGVRPWFVSAGGLAVLGNENSEQGAYFVWGTGSPMASGNFDAAVGNPYVATVILHVPDSQYGLVSAPEPYIQVYKGTAAASPTALPDSTWNVGGASYVPGAWFRVGDVRVNTGDTGLIPGAQFTSNNKYVKNAFATHIGLSTDTFPDAKLGDFRYDIETGRVRQLLGSGWRGIQNSDVFTAIQSNAGTDLVSPTNATKVASNLTFSAEANATYDVTYKLRYWGEAGEDASINFTLPAGGTIMPNSLSIRSLTSGASAPDQVVYNGTFFSNPDLATIGCTNTSQGLLARVDVVFKTVSAGAVTLNFGQKVAGSDAATLAASSTMRAVRIA